MKSTIFLCFLFLFGDTFSDSVPTSPALEPRQQRYDYKLTIATGNFGATNNSHAKFNLKAYFADATSLTYHTSCDYQFNDNTLQQCKGTVEFIKPPVTAISVTLTADDETKIYPTCIIVDVVIDGDTEKPLKLDKCFDDAYRGMVNGDERIIYRIPIEAYTSPKV